MLFDRTQFLGQVPLRTLGKVYSGDVSFVGDQICKIAEAWVTGTSDPRESQLYQDEFNRWYDKVASIGWKEAELTEYIRQFCPKAVPTFLQMRANWTSKRNTARQRPLPPPLPATGAPVPSQDPSAVFRRLLRPPPPARPPTATLPTTRPTGMVTPSSFSPTPTYYQPSSYQQSSIQEECPPGQFRAYPGGPCRGAVATGGLPTLPGGFSSADVSTSSFSTPSAPVWGMSGARRPIPVMNLRRRG